MIIIHDHYSPFVYVPRHTNTAAYGMVRHLRREFTENSQRIHTTEDPQKIHRRSTEDLEKSNLANKAVIHPLGHPRPSDWANDGVVVFVWCFVSFQPGKMSLSSLV
jgi:hypothetical protein